MLAESAIPWPTSIHASIAWRHVGHSFHRVNCPCPEHGRNLNSQLSSAIFAPILPTEPEDHDETIDRFPVNGLISAVQNKHSVHQYLEIRLHSGGFLSSFSIFDIFAPENLKLNSITSNIFFLGHEKLLLYYYKCQAAVLSCQYQLQPGEAVCRT